MPVPNPVDLKAVSAAFHTPAKFKAIAAELGISPNRLRRLWTEEFGAEAVKDRAETTRRAASEEALAEADSAFDSNEPFKAVAARLGISPNTLRKRWVAAHGKEAFDERGRRLQKAGQARFAQRSTGVPKTKNYVEYFCEGCSAVVTLTRQQFSMKKKKVLCKDCLDAGKDLECPVCQLKCKGQKGLATHFRHQEDKAHTQYQEDLEEKKWESLVEGLDYVTCWECGFKGQSLFSHLRLHNLTAEAYRIKYPGASILCDKSLSKKRANTKSFSYDLTREDLLAHVDDRGRVVVEAVARVHQCLEGTVLRYCRKYDIPSRNNLSWQRAVLEQAQAFLDEDYEWEWSHEDARNPDTGRPFNYDGFFPKSRIVVEAHGDQHFFYSEKWHGYRERFAEFQERDLLKRRLVEALGLTLKVVRPSDPIYEPSFWEGLFSDDPSLWENKTISEKKDRIRAVLHRLRQEGWPQNTTLPPRYAKVELSKLEKVHPYLDENRDIHPYSVRGTTVCGSFFPNRYEARNSKGRLSVREAWDDDVMLEQAIRLQLDSGHPTTALRVLKALIFYCRTPSVFRPAVAKYVYQTYCPEGGTVWDPCAGYGGRLMGAMAARVGKYIATDVEPQTVEGNRDLAEALEVQGKCEIHEARAETFDPEVPLDLVFTSPPYFNLEVYGDASQSAYHDYGDAMGWVRQFLTPIMKTALERLKPGGYLVLNLPTKPVEGVRLDAAAELVAETMGFQAQDSVYLPIRRMKTRTLKREPLLVWRESEN